MWPILCYLSLHLDPFSRPRESSRRRKHGPADRGVSIPFSYHYWNEVDCRLTSLKASRLVGEPWVAGHQCRRVPPPSASAIITAADGGSGGVPEEEPRERDRFRLHARQTIRSREYAAVSYEHLHVGAYDTRRRQSGDPAARRFRSCVRKDRKTASCELYTRGHTHALRRPINDDRRRSVVDDDANGNTRGS